MTDPPPAKKPRVGTGEPAAAEDNVEEHALPGNIGPELIARVASFSRVGMDVMNICLAVGPKDSNIVRRTYLRKNEFYLVDAMRQYYYRTGRKSKCRDDFRAWMGVNSDWKSLGTAERMEMLQTVRRYDEESDRLLHLLHPFVAFNNPFVAIQLGLVEVLKFLVEEKGIDVNSYAWTSYTSRGRAYHLVATAMHDDDMEAFRYLLSLDNIDLDSTIFEDKREKLIRLALHPACPAGPEFLETFVQHPSIDVNASCIDSTDWSTTPLLFSLAVLKSEPACPNRLLGVWMEKFKTLLKAGADPTLHAGVDIALFAQRTVSPLEVAAHMISALPTGSARVPVWEEALSLMQGNVVGGGED